MDGLKNKIMQKIKEDKIQMRHPLVFLTKKLGLQSVLILDIVGGAFVLSVILYALKKTGILKFLSLGPSGFKVVLFSLPYDYIALFIIAVILANYLARKLDFSIGKSFFANAPGLTLLLLTILIGAFFAFMGVEQIIHGVALKNVPGEMAVSGTIINCSPKEAIIQDVNGQIERVIFNQDKLFKYKQEYAKGRMLRATGKRSNEKEDVFEADDFRCCDED